MSLDVDTRLSVYGTLVPIGAGGLSEVYKAKDTWLDRDQGAASAIPPPKRTRG